MKDYVLGFAVACVLFLGYEVYEAKRVQTPQTGYSYLEGWLDYGSETDFSDFGYDFYVDVPDEIPT